MMKKIIGLIICVVVFSSCARIVTPTGGEKDYTPPKVKRSFPKNVLPMVAEKGHCH